MISKLIAAGALLAGLGLFSFAQETPKATVDAYNSLADTILALKRTEEGFIRSVLDGHHHAAKAFSERGVADRAAAEMALFANEGDNAMGGVRKRLVEGGHHHHHHSDATGKDEYDPGYVIVSKAAKEKLMAASAAMRAAKSDADRAAAWQQFDAVAAGLLKTK